jgi:uncharacterized membrane protein
MLSNHYGVLYGARHNWLVLVLVMAAGALIRHFFVARHKALVQGRPLPWGHAIAGCVLLAAVIAWLAPAQPTAAASGAVAFAQVQTIVAQRCVLCHNAQLPNKGVALDSAEGIERLAQALYQQAVLQKTMPLNNATQITDAERALLGRWFEAGAKAH